MRHGCLGKHSWKQNQHDLVNNYPCVPTVKQILPVQAESASVDSEKLMLLELRALCKILLILKYFSANVILYLVSHCPGVTEWHPTGTADLLWEGVHLLSVVKVELVFGCCCLAQLLSWCCPVGDSRIWKLLKVQEDSEHPIPVVSKYFMAVI